MTEDRDRCIGNGEPMNGAWWCAVQQMEATLFTCPICESPAQDVSERAVDASTVKCPKCPTYKITGTARETVRTKPLEVRAAILLAAIDRAGPGKMPEIDSFDLGRSV